MARQLCEDKSRDMASSSAGFGYSDVSSTMGTHVVNQQIQGFVSDDPEMFNLTTGMEMIGFSKNLQQHSDWKTSFLAKPSHHQAPSSSTHFYHQHHDYNKPYFTSGISEPGIVGAPDSAAADWQHNRLLVDDSSLRCAFPCEPNERPTQGLSLSLSSTNPSAGIGLQSFELRHNNNNHQQQEDFVSSSSREGLFGKSASSTQQMLPDGYLSKAANLYQGHFLLKKYLVPAQQLLIEFCGLGNKQSDNDIVKQKSSQKNKQWQEENGSGPSKKLPLGTLEFVELQKRKTRLLSMLEEVERRYRHYCNQMKGVVSSFEAVAGNGAATVYSALALKAMSRHFKCLKDGIMGELQATRKAMGEKDPVAADTTTGETPKLRIIDQALRQQRAFQQMGTMESHPWRPQRGLPERSVSLLRGWLFEHFLNPYPSDADKHILARQTGLSRSQVSNWFINARVRLWKPMVEEMYTEEVKEHEKKSNMACSEGDMMNSGNGDGEKENPPPRRSEDQKPRVPDECVSTSSLMSNPKSSRSRSLQFQNQHPIPQQEGFGTVELDFSGGGMVSFSNENYRGGGVSLTLGLQQQDGGSGASLAFPPPTASTPHTSLLYPKHPMDDCQPESVHYSLLDSQPQNLPYTHLMASHSHLLHDLAG